MPKRSSISIFIAATSALAISTANTDSVTVTPAVFGGTDRNGTAGADIVGAVLETTFKF